MAMEDILIPYRNGHVVVLADLHLDTYGWGPDLFLAHGIEGKLRQGPDALIIAGDLINGLARHWPQVFDLLVQYMPTDRIYILPGNHDYYDGNILDDARLQKQVQADGAHFVQKCVLQHGKTRFLCCTLWTDFALLGEPTKAMGVSKYNMRDYSRITKPDPDHLGLPGEARALQPEPWITPMDILGVHRDHRAWLQQALLMRHHAGEVGQTVVVTHHGPHPNVAGPIDGLTPSFHSDLSDLIVQHHIDAWFFGHSHRRLRASFKGTDIRNVSVGYQGEISLQEAGYLRDACVWKSQR